MKHFFSKFVKRFHKSSQTSRSPRTEHKAHNQADRLLLVCILTLSGLGILMVYDSSVAIAIREFNNPLYFIREQGKWLLFGAVILLFFSRLDYRRLYALAFPLLMATILLLIAVFLPGVGVSALGAKRWIDVGIFVLQPAEFAKLALVIYLAAWFCRPEKERLGAFLLLVSMVVGLVVAEPDLGTAIILVSIAVVLYFFSGAPAVHFAFLVPIIVVVVFILAIAAPYRFNRLTTFLNPEHDPLGAGYQIRQSLLAIGSGGWFGMGVGKSRQKYEYLPEANTDSIFAIIGEETGFFGASLVALSYLFITWRGYRIAKRVSSSFGRYLALGIGSWIGIQAVINISAMVALMPLTGVPLPFISYGGSSLVVMLAAMGILLNISRL